MYAALRQFALTLSAALCLLMPLSAAAERTIVFAIDYSNSMWSHVDGVPSYLYAEDLLRGAARIAAETGADTQFALVTFGDQFKRGADVCKADVRRAIAPTRYDVFATALRRETARMRPNGQTPLFTGVTEALDVIEELIDDGGAGPYEIVLLTDLEAACDTLEGETQCQLGRRIAEQIARVQQQRNQVIKLSFVVGLGGTMAAVEEMANCISGTEFVPFVKRGQIDDFLEKLLKDNVALAYDVTYALSLEPATDAFGRGLGALLPAQLTVRSHASGATKPTDLTAARTVVSQRVGTYSARAVAAGIASKVVTFDHQAPSVQELTLVLPQVNLTAQGEGGPLGKPVEWVVTDGVDGSTTTVSTRDGVLRTYLLPGRPYDISGTDSDGTSYAQQIPLLSTSVTAAVRKAPAARPADLVTRDLQLTWRAQSPTLFAHDPSQYFSEISGPGGVLVVTQNGADHVLEVGDYTVTVFRELQNGVAPIVSLQFDISNAAGPSPILIEAAIPATRLVASTSAANPVWVVTDLQTGARAELSGPVLSQDVQPGRYDVGLLNGPSQTVDAAAARYLDLGDF